MHAKRKKEKKTHIYITGNQLRKGLKTSAKRPKPITFLSETAKEKVPGHLGLAVVWGYAIRSLDSRAESNKGNPVQLGARVHLWDGREQAEQEII